MKPPYDIISFGFSIMSWCHLLPKLIVEKHNHYGEGHHQDMNVYAIHWLYFSLSIQTQQAWVEE